MIGHAGPRALTCPECSAPTQYRAPFCSYCRTPLTWGRVPELLEGDELSRLELRSAPLPLHRGTAPSWRATARGAEVQVAARRLEMGAVEGDHRDLSVAVTGVTDDPSVGLGVVARLHAIGSARAFYVLTVRPRFRAVQLALVLWGDGETHFHDLAAWESLPGLPGLGERFTVELRVADSLLQGFVDGVNVVSVVDGALGYGAAGWRVASYDAPGSAFIERIALRRLR